MNTIILLISSIIVLLILVNFYFWRKTLHSIDIDLKQQPWFNCAPKDYIRNCYDFIADHYQLQRHSWARLWKNLFYKDNWKHARSIPCHMYALFYNHCLKLRFPKSKVRLRYTPLLSQKILIHFYSNVLLDGIWLNIDSWGKKRGVPFGKTILMPDWKR